MKTETETPNQTKIDISLYHIEAAMIGLIEAREAAETDGDRAVCDEQLRLYVAAEVRKVDGILAMMRHCKMHAEVAKAEAERLGKIARTWGRRLERLEDATLGAMQAGQITRLEGNLGMFCLVRNPPSVEIQNDSLIPLEYKTANITMPAELWIGLCEFLTRFATVVEALAPHVDAVTIQGCVDSFAPRKEDIKQELKRTQDCTCAMFDSTPDPECSVCGGSGKESCYVAGARLVTDKVRLEVR